MKLRILNNAIRIRLSQTEVSALQTNNEVVCRTAFAQNELVYKLVLRKGIDDVTAQFDEYVISINVPVDIAEAWLNSPSAGFENKDQSQLKILVEKDFQCLHKRPGEDESDNFPNPLAKTQL